MSRYRVIGAGQGGTPRVKHHASTEAIGPEFHTFEISIGAGMEMNLTRAEAKALFYELGEILVPESPDEIADRISEQRSVGGYSGLDDNTRKIIRGAALQAVKAARGLPERTPFNPIDRLGKGNRA